MLLEHDGRRPQVDPTARIAPNATLCGDVRIGPGCSIGFGAVLVTESGPVELGADCVVMDTAVLRGSRRHPLSLGARVLVGPHASLSGCTVEDEAFLATGCAVFNGARIGRRAEVRVNGIVHLRSVLPAEAVVPLGWIAVGDPAEILPPEAHERIWEIQQPLDFPRTVFGVPRPAPRGSIMPEVMPRYARALGRHKADREV
ncbi:Carbonic anhydrase or acetyltransferase, isoleucine patch superfamily [Tistlia consotensis]|uniref:Carbonic anhydrase or acetyltransferase, isoleucine patch superfamily n=1 Tax=Tistlia consotensis USBA 355 TaxID=560819 RepID=A0A1Y6BFP4_9PROT|nr:gamma carbonic anhydrase family protein [Tistlia consotensis]SMF02052.1 Carbonic anhydrase or acetyltransferase, isoleucine patch superfamily [Tistlia consotensis USBA 355]SNS26262.1 Carbonic anhydrase or acetyltransferase, isoleucine patch superfamily [Tistlia consotensis]